MQNSVQEGNVKNNRTQHIENGAQTPPQQKGVQNTSKTVREALTYQIIKKNTYKTVRKTVTLPQIVQNTFKTVREALNSRQSYKTHSK